MSDVKGAREIRIGIGSEARPGHIPVQFVEAHNTTFYSNEIIELIERSAYLELQKERDELRDELDNKRGAMTLEIYRLTKERDELKAEVERTESQNKRLRKMSELETVKQLRQERDQLREQAEKLAEALTIEREAVMVLRDCLANLGGLNDQEFVKVCEALEAEKELRKKDLKDLL